MNRLSRLTLEGVCSHKWKAMQQMGILRMEHLLVQELPEEEWTLGDGCMEYAVINGNHCLQVA